MPLEQCTYLQELAEDCLQTSSSGMNQLSLLNGTPIAAESCASVPQTDGSPACKCTKGMLGCSIHPNTRVEWIAFMQDSLAQTLAVLESKRGLARAQDRGFTEKSCELLGSWDSLTCSWKTCQPSLLKDSESCLGTWPRWGMCANGFVYAHPISGQTMSVTDGSSMRASLATPTATANQLAPSMMKHKSCKALAKAMLPTPTAHNSKEGNYPAERTRNTPTLAAVLGGKINPQFTEWMMGWPIGHTELKLLETDKSHSKRQLHSKSYQDNDL